MIEVGAYRTRGEAEFAQAALAVEGIPSVLAADDAGGAYPFVLAGAARLLVDEADAEDAAAVLSEHSQGHTQSGNDDDDVGPAGDAT
jgi:cell division protein FtsN